MPNPYGRDPMVKALRRAVQRRDWASVVAIFEPTTDPDLVWLYTGVVAKMRGTEAWLAEMARVEPTRTLPKLLLGHRLVAWAWDARGDGPASQVRRGAWKLFFDRLLDAENALGEVVAREPDNVAAWSELIVTSRARQLGIDESRRRFEQVVSRCPTHLGAHQMMLQQLCEKWGGSHAMMHEFAREAARRAPPASALGGLVAEAHVEEWVQSHDNLWSLDRFRYFREPEVRAELALAAQRSTAHPDYQFRLSDLDILNALAFVFVVSRRRRLARQQYRLIRGRATMYPWVYSNQLGRARPAFWLHRLRAYGLLP